MSNGSAVKDRDNKDSPFKSSVKKIPKTSNDLIKINADYYKNRYKIEKRMNKFNKSFKQVDNKLKFDEFKFISNKFELEEGF